MSYCTVTLSANAGVALTIGGAKLWIDALHDRRVPGFSPVTPELFARLMASDAFASPDAILFTHCHPDHCSPELTERALTGAARPPLFAPEPVFPDGTLLTGDEFRARVGGVTLTFWRLTHEKEQYASVPHYGVLLSDGAHSVLVPGDCAIASPALAERLRGIHIDLALLDFPWVTLPRGRMFLEQHLHADSLAVYHLPIPEEDENRYGEVSRRGATRIRSIPDIRFLDRPLRTLVF